MKKILHLAGIALLLLTASCKDELAGCTEGEVLFEADNWSGTITTVDGLLAIRRHVPGTIDSFITGVLCEEDAVPDSLQSQQQKVIFSGKYFDDKGNISPNTVIGGEEFYLLRIGEISSDEL